MTFIATARGVLLRFAGRLRRRRPQVCCSIDALGDRQLVARLKIGLEGTAEGVARVLWRRIYTAVGPSGTRVVAELDQAAAEVKTGDLVRCHGIAGLGAPP